MGKLATIFQAEVLAILRCAENLIERGRHNNCIYICLDSRTAIIASIKITTKVSVVWDCMQTIYRLEELSKIILTWVPGHHGILGNEIADGYRN